MSDPDNTQATSPRTRTVTWEDPLIDLRAFDEMAGRACLEAVRDGRLPPPPIAELIGFRLAEVDDGRVVFTSTPGEEHYNPIGAVHGGFAATLLDSAMGCAIATALPRCVTYTTLELKVNFIRALTKDTGPVRAEGTIIHFGRTTATAEGRIIDAQGRLFAHATTTCLIIRPSPTDL